MGIGNLIGCVLTAFITGILSLIGVVYTSKKQHDKTITEVSSTLNTQIELIKKDITSLDETVKKHNNVIERMYSAETAISVLEEKIKVANNRIEDLERSGNDGR